MSPHDPRPDQPAPVPPPGGEGTRRKPRRVVRRGTETAEVSGISADERGEGWSEGAGRESDDAHLLRDLPPHWGGAGYRD